MISRLRKKLIIYTSILFLILLTFAMSILYVAIEDTLYDNAKESAFSVANSIYIALDDNIFNSVQLAAFIGNDPFLRDFFSDEINDLEKLQTYLENIKSIYNYNILYLASFQTNHYYTNDGLVKTFISTVDEDKWYFDIKNTAKETKNYRPLVTQDPEQIVFNNIYVIKDNNNTPMGFIQIGIDYTKTISLIKESINTLNANVYIINSSGDVETVLFEVLNKDTYDLSSAANLAQLVKSSNLKENSLLQLVKNKTSITVKYIKELDSYLIITQDLSSNVFYTFLLVLVIVILLLSCILLITLKLLNYSNNKILHEASLDSLTQIYNRSIYNTKLTEAIELTTHYNIPSSLIFIDIDDFKTINDEMGHDVGDEVIIKIARLLEENKRNNDILFRWGGDEFGVIVRSNLENALQIANRILVSSGKIHWKDNTSISLSIGVTEILCNDTKKMVFNRADEALYNAKSQGKNRVFYK